MMQVESFHWLRHYICTMLYKYGKRMCNFFWVFYFCFSLVFYIMGACSMKKNYSTCACWI